MDAGRSWRDDQGAHETRAATATGDEVRAGSPPEPAMGWEVGDRIAELYEVREVHGQGGMGLVYRVRHLGWEVDLAVKSPRPELFRTEADKERFTREAETWVSLGLHPHVCGCHYVRTLGGLPRVFAEYVDGGSLREWIDDGRLYRGSQRESLARILDLAIQTAWGLAHAHGHGVVHQDVKPANVLVDAAGTAKVTDFGLARSRPPGPVGGRPGGDLPAGGSILVTTGGMTPAYASPEQVAGGRLGRRSDVWSFAVSVLEMFTGEVTWLAGPVAGAALAEYRRPGHSDAMPVALPEPLAALLARCLDDDPAGRPGSMAEVADRLVEIYRQQVGTGYRRVPPAAADLRADELNNRALSLLDLGKVDEAEAAFHEARAVDPQHLPATYNAGLRRWRTGGLADDELVRQLEAVRDSLGSPWQAQHLLAKVHLERGDPGAALPLLETALGQASAERPATRDQAVQTDLRRARDGVGAAGRRLRTLAGHTGEVFSLSLSADGRFAWSGSSDATVRVWEIDTGRCVHVVDLPHTSAVQDVRLSADGRRAITRSRQGQTQLWEVETGRCLHTLDTDGDGRTQRIPTYGHGCAVTSIGLSTDGRLALTGDGDTAVRLWDVATGRCLRTFEGHTSSVKAVCLSAGGRLAVSGGDAFTRVKDTTVRLWDVATGRCLHVLEGHASTVSAVCLSADGRYALSGSWDTTVRLWDVATGRCRRVLAGHTGRVNAVCLSADGRLAVTGSSDGTVRLWELDSGRCRHTLDGNAGWVYAVALGADGRRALSGHQDGTLRRSELPDAYPGAYQPCRPRSHGELTRAETRAAALLAEAERAIAEGSFPAAHALLAEARQLPGYERAPRILETWRRLALSSSRVGVRAAWPVRTLEVPGGSSAIPARVYAVSMSADGRLALSAHQDKTLRLWEVATGQCLRVLEGHTTYKVHSVSMSADGRLAVSGSGDDIGRVDCTLRLWDLATGRCLRVLEGHSNEVHSVSMSTDGQLVLSGSQDKTVRLWEVATGRCLRTFTLEGYHGQVRSVYLSRDRRFALSGSADHAVRLWDVYTGQCLRILEGHAGEVTSVCLSTDGRLALSGGGYVREGKDTTVRLWDLATGRCLRVLEGHTDRVHSVCLSTDGRFALSGSEDKTLRLWDVDAGQCLSVLEGHTGAVVSVGISADGSLALSGGGYDFHGNEDGTVRLWEIDWELAAREPADWHDGARPQLAMYLSRHSGHSWSDADFDELLHHLQHAGYGWLRPRGVKAELERMAREWQGPPPPAGS